MADLLEFISLNGVSDFEMGLGENSIIPKKLTNAQFLDSQQKITNELESIFSDWGQIETIIPKEDFIGWGTENIPENCFDYAWTQLKNAGFDLVSPAYFSRKHKNKIRDSHIFQLYTTKDGIYVSQTINAIKYLKYAIQNSIPVLAGVDDNVGSPNFDRTTDHFIVIVGMGFDKYGKYFRFFDNATSSIEEGTSILNRLYIRTDTLEIIGLSQNDYFTNSTEKYYQLSQVRESKPR